MSKKEVLEKRIVRGAKVRWYSHGGTGRKEKRGETRAFVPAGRSPKSSADRAGARVTWSRWRGEDPARARRAASYIVEVPRQGICGQKLVSDFYCVLAVVLEQQNPRAKREVSRE